MCAIAGILDLKNDYDIVNNMLESMQRRGPDQNGSFYSDSCCLLHSRLSIIDPQGGKQPMTLVKDGEEYTIVYNGELYNTEEIKSVLRSLGHTFEGHSDTEVLLHAYAQWQSKCLEYLNGIYAFAVWEKNMRRLFLARDRMGVKPLFYSTFGGGLVFASEIKTILAYPEICARLDESGVAELLLLGPGRTPGCGVLKDIYELEPGCYGYYEDHKLTCRSYWKLLDRCHTDSFEDTVAYVRYLVVDAIERQMVSDVPIGAFLSGGLDSSIICTVCANKLSQSGEHLKTFSVDYKNNDKYFKPGKFQPSSDRYYIDIMRQFLSSDHITTEISPVQLAEAIENSTQARDLPGMADVDFSLLIFCKEIRKKAKVALSGECADEIFGGYPWFRDLDIRIQDGFPWSQNIAQRKCLMHQYWCDKIDATDYVMDRYYETINNCDILPENTEENKRMKQMTYLNQRWFMQTLLDRKDRMSMFNSLEVRVPFCDHRIAEYLYAVPWEYKDYQNREKGLLRCAVEDLLPQEIVYRKKSPYPKTYDPMYMKIVSQMLQDVINNPDSPILQITDKNSLIKLVSAQNDTPWYGQLMKVPQTIAYMLQINYWMKAYRVQLI